MRLKHLFALIISCGMLLGFTACSDRDYAPIVVTEVNDSSSIIENNTVYIDAFSEGENFHIWGGNRHYFIECQDKDIADFRYDGKILTIVPTGLGRTSLLISDEVGNNLTLTVEVKNPVKNFKVTAVESEVHGDEMIMSDVTLLKKKVVNEALTTIGGGFEFTYTDPELTMGSVNIYTSTSGRPVSGIFRQKNKVSNTQVPYVEFSITLANDEEHKLMLLNYGSLENPDLILQEDVTDIYKGLYPKLENALLTYKVSL